MIMDATATTYEDPAADDTGLGDDLGQRFARSIADHDADALRGLLAERIDFRALTPRRFWEAEDREAVIDIVFGTWFEPTDVITEVLEAGTDRMADRTSLHYRLRGHNADGDFLIEQQAYAQHDGGTVDWLRIICSGFRPAATT